MVHRRLDIIQAVTFYGTHTLPDSLESIDDVRSWLIVLKKSVRAVDQMFSAS